MKLATQVGSTVRLRFYAKLCLAVICGCMFLNGQLGRAQTPDPCASPSGGQTGAGAVGQDGGGLCSVIITVSAVDTHGHAIAFNAATTGTPAYDGLEDILVGVQNSSGAPLNSITLTSPDTSNGGIFGFDGDGPCIEHIGGYPWCSTAGFFGYEGPMNTFTRGNTAPFTTGTVNFTSAIPDGGTTWFALEGSPQSLAASGQTQIQDLSPDHNDFFFNPFDTTNPTRQTIVYSTSGTDPTGTQMQVTFLAISDAQYQNLVAGTFAQGSFCMPQEVSPNTFSCAVTIALCKGPTDTTFTGQHCPQASSGPIGVIMKYFTGASSPFQNASDVPSPGYLAATDNALNCGTDADNSCRQLHNIFTKIADDCCTTSGGTKSFNSLFAPAGCVGFSVSSVDANNVPGFTAPVLNAPAVNFMSSKQAIPLKLTVVKNTFQSGACTATTPVSNLNLFGSTTAGTVNTVQLSAGAAPAGTCSNPAVDTSTVSTSAAGASGWQILGNGQYQYNWQPNAPVGSCIQFSVDLGDGVQHTAYFNVNKK